MNWDDEACRRSLSAQQEGTFCLRPTGLRPKFVVSANGRGVVSHAGSRPPADLVRRHGADRLLRHNPRNPEDPTRAPGPMHAHPPTGRPTTVSPADPIETGRSTERRSWQSSFPSRLVNPHWGGRRDGRIRSRAHSFPFLAGSTDQLARAEDHAEWPRRREHRCRWRRARLERHPDEAPISDTATETQRRAWRRSVNRAGITLTRRSRQRSNAPFAKATSLTVPLEATQVT
jgi:hypothetical protein